MLSLLRKLSIGSKIKDGISPDDKMATTDNNVIEKNEEKVFTQDENELKDTVYGKIKI